MAPRSSPDASQPRFGSGFCSTSMAPTPPASGFFFDTRPHLQRLLQSSASPNEDPSFQIQPQQIGQFYLQQRPEHSAVESHRASNNAEVAMVADLSRDPTQLGQALQSYVQGSAGSGASILPSLMRYHSAPSSMLASLTGMGNTIMNPNSELGQFLSSSVVADVKGGLKPMDASHDRSHNHIENRGIAAASVDRLVSHSNGFVPPHAPYQRGELMSQMSMDADDVPLIRSPADGLPDVSKAALHSPSSYSQKSAYMHNTAYVENGNGIAHGMPTGKDGLLRHSSSPAGFLSQVNDEHERHGLPSSSGNSSEEGSYEGQGGRGFLSGYAWDDTGIMTIGPSDGSSGARKRIRDLAEKGYSGPTILDSQKVDALDRSVLGNYFGLQTTSSPESTYFADKFSPDSIPCRARAKRGCATHPRSIAERNRRTKISERMKKLQELMPNIDKQANTAEMLDEAVEYVKYLQRQVQELRENRSKCNCACSKQKESNSPPSR
ncbi:hypothetical protein GOP47_0013440 [Adiantum capillus-veneris]|uniref:BHLH domain-containing protein n=1 Tax=Adiantum capillus-veneris TaxID=13818 RepID=A0A9D4UP30_ADICA|nr:hypothetical protein GOP47_0013440 [Adiantum capillus-veneris]